MKEFATDQENKSLVISDRYIALSGKDYDVWRVRAEQISKIHLSGNKRSINIDANILEENQHYKAVFIKDIYPHVETFFTTQLKNIKVRKSSKILQMAGPLLAAVIFVVMTGISLSKGILSRELYDKSEFVIIGVVGLFILLAMKAYFFPKKEATVIFKKGNQVINYTK